jgi:hypothetical protein
MLVCVKICVAIIQLDWRDGDLIVDKRLKKIHKILELENLINLSKSNSEFVNSNSKFTIDSKVKKSLY